VASKRVLEAKDKKGKTPLFYAVQADDKTRYHIVTTLVKHGASLLATNLDGETCESFALRIQRVLPKSFVASLQGCQSIEHKSLSSVSNDSPSSGGSGTPDQQKQEILEAPVVSKDRSSKFTFSSESKMIQKFPSYQPKLQEEILDDSARKEPIGKIHKNPWKDVCVEFSTGSDSTPHQTPTEDTIAQIRKLIQIIAMEKGDISIALNKMLDHMNQRDQLDRQIMSELAEIKLNLQLAMGRPRFSPKNPPEDASPASKTGDQNDCVICSSQRRSVVFTTCGHYVCCYDCATRLLEGDVNLCPICRAEISEDDTLRVYT